MRTARSGRGGVFRTDWGRRRGSTRAGRAASRRVRAYTVMVVQILVVQRQTHHPLRHQHRKTMLRAPRIAVVVETLRQTTADTEQPIRFPKQQRTPSEVIQPGQNPTPPRGGQNVQMTAALMYTPFAWGRSLLPCMPLNHIRHRKTRPHAHISGEISGPGHPDGMAASRTEGQGLDGTCRKHKGLGSNGTGFWYLGYNSRVTGAASPLNIPSPHALGLTHL